MIPPGELLTILMRFFDIDVEYTSTCLFSNKSNQFFPVDLNDEINRVGNSDLGISLAN